MKMLIVDQEKDTIINFDEIKLINIHRQYRNNICAWFAIDDRSSVLLGKYKDEQRCREVIKDMIEFLYNSNTLKGSMNTDAAIAHAQLTKYRIYNMPEK
jgi:hypothetical protein